MKNRKLVIGDIHGAYLALNQALDRAGLTENDQLIFLGDYVDGWSQSKELIDYLIELNESYSCIFIRGNHDTWCEKWLQMGETNETWLLHGGLYTLDSYISIDEDSKQKHLEFFKRMKNYHIDEKNNLYIHAGYSSIHGPAKETYPSNCFWDRTLWETAVTMDKSIKKDSKFYPKRLKVFNEIFIGHTPTIDYDIEEPMNAVNIWNMDTGAAFYGKLSVLDADTKEFWQSDAVQKLYPSEKGRNK